MGSRGGRDRFRRDYPPRSEDKSHHGRSNPPSRHLWVGNLSHNLTESTLAHHFLQFGELESVSFQPGRSYAFINYKNDEDAFAAIRELQGYVVAGNPLRIEFTKAEKSSLPPRGEDYVQHRDQQRSLGRRSPFSQRDSGVRHFSPDPPYLDKTKSSDKSTEPSEVLWIGFPAQLKVDEFILRKAFSPFGEIEKITAFPGRTYAFVRFKNVMAACRAKDTLQGKLFGNPRVHICFAKNESGTSNRERDPVDAPPSSHFRSFGHAGSSENFRQDRHYGDIAGDPSMRSRFVSNLEPSDPDVIGFGRKDNLWSGGNAAFEQGRFPELRSGLGPPENVYEPHSSPLDRGAPLRERGTRFRDYSPPQLPPGGPFYDDPWDLPEDVSLFHGAKKLKTGSFPPENELPEYPFSASVKSTRIPSMVYPELPQPEAYDMNLEAGPLGYKPIADRIMNSTDPYGDRSDRSNVSYDESQVSSVSLPSKPDWKRLTPESQPLSLNKEWKWEGTIAKGGTPVCRARCFPVGKVLEMMLPEFLDCTARTSLDMLAKHYYQAASAWVVFFVPANDPDIAYYNEFMNYLGEKERAAVAKLDDRTTLFLVPPSDFSEKVLKVPGRLSISGVVLRLEQSGSSYGSLPLTEQKDTNLTSFHGNTTHPKPTSPSGPYSSVPFIPNFEKSKIISTSYPENFSKGVSPASYSGSAHSVGNISDSINGDRHEYLLRQQSPAVGPNWFAHDIQNANNRSVVSQASNRTVDSIGQRYVMPRSVQDNSINYTTEMAAIPLSESSRLPVQEKPPAPSSMPVVSLQTEQLAQLASSLFGQKRQSGIVSTGEDFRQSGTSHQSENSYRTSQNYAPPNSNISSELSSSQFGQVQQRQHIPNIPGAPQKELQPSSQLNQQSLNAGQEEDPQTRLQATLQLAAALLQQIQGKGT